MYPAPAGFHAVDAVDLPGPCDQFLRDGAGRFFQLPGELECDGRGKFAEFDFRSLVEDDVRRFDIPLCSDCRSECIFQTRMKVKQHKRQC